MPLGLDARPMRLPRVQFTVRWLMIAVSVVPLFTGAVAERGRRRTVLIRATLHHAEIHGRP